MKEIFWNWKQDDGKVTPHGIPHKAVSSMIVNIAEDFGTKTIIETGTAFGANIENIVDYFDDLFTIELSESHYLGSQENLLKYRKVRSLFGSSTYWIPGILTHFESKTPILFYLDAHYSGGDTAIDETLDTPNCPLLYELKNIGLHMKDGDVIICDDLRLFKEQPFHEEGYPSIEEINEVIEERFPVGYVTATVADQLVITPRELDRRYL